MRYAAALQEVLMAHEWARNVVLAGWLWQEACDTRKVLQQVLGMMPAAVTD